MRIMTSDSALQVILDTYRSHQQRSMLSSHSAAFSISLSRVLTGLLDYNELGVKVEDKTLNAIAILSPTLNDFSELLFINTSECNRLIRAFVDYRLSWSRGRFIALPYLSNIDPISDYFNLRSFFTQADLNTIKEAYDCIPIHENKILEILKSINAIEQIKNSVQSLVNNK